VADADAGLVEALRRDDPGSAEHLVEAYGERAYRLAVRITAVKEDAVEAVENALRAVAGTIHTFTGESTFASWIVRTVANVAYQKLRHRRQDVSEIALADVVPLLDGDGRHFEPMYDWSNRIDEPALRGELCGVLTEAIDALPAEYRAALVLHDVEAMSKPDIATIVGLDVRAMESRVHRARLFVRQRLSEYFEPAKGRERPCRPSTHEIAGNARNREPRGQHLIHREPFGNRSGETGE
jgi:RNA polymerase sigma-70 factor, ECF subfamily